MLGTTERPQPLMSMHLRVAGRTDVGPVRDKNDDAFIATDLRGAASSLAPRWTGRLDSGDGGVLLAVADGPGSGWTGDVASALVMSSLAQGLEAQLRGAYRGDAAYAVWADACGRGIQMGARFTAVHIRGSVAYVVQVGRPPAYIIRTGRIIALARDRSYVKIPLDPEADFVVDPLAQPLRNIVVSARSHQPALSIELGRLDLQGRDCLLLCSTALSTKFSDVEMRDVILGSCSLSFAADRLVDLANERGGEKDDTVVLAGVTAHA
jgi:serine/threonine protein phosphatase PrpC